MKSLMLASVLTLTALVANGAELTMTQIKIDKKTPSIVPSEQIYQFSEIDWDEVEARQNAGKQNGDSVVMQCDDSYYQLVEIKLPEGLASDISIESDCKLHGASHDGDYSPAWLQFDGPSGTSGCTIKVQKSRADGKKPLLVEYEISDAC